MRVSTGAMLLAVVGITAACGSTESDVAEVEGAAVDVDDPEILDPEVAARTEGWSVEPEAEETLRAACDVLAAAKRFSFHAEVMEELVLDSGAKVDTSREGDVHVRRPNGLFVERRQADGQRRLYYDGSTAALLDVSSNLYVLAEEPPPDLDGFLDFLVDRLDVAVPLADVIVSDPYTALREPALGGVHLGESLVRGTVCDHLGFGNGRIEWQIWVQSEGLPLIRKAVINYRDEPGAPRWEAYLSDWKLEDALPDAAFTFVPPEGSHRIETVDLPEDGEE